MAFASLSKPLATFLAFGAVGRAIVLQDQLEAVDEPSDADALSDERSLGSQRGVVRQVSDVSEVLAHSAEEEWPRRGPDRRLAHAQKSASHIEPGEPFRQLMVNVGDIEYVSYVTVGGQQVAGILDSGSFELVVFSSDCSSCGRAAKYDPKRSSSHTSGSMMTVQSYGSGDTYSWEAHDQVVIGPFAPENQSFWEVVDARMPILKNAAFNAIVGVGPPETPASDAWQEVQRNMNTLNKYFEDARKPPVDVIKGAQESLDSAIQLSKSPPMLSNFGVSAFSVCMGASPGSDGYFVWQDNSPEKNADFFTRIQVLGTHTWSVELTNVRLTRPGSFSDTKLGCGKDTPCSALVDTGTSLLAVPKEVIDKVEATVEAQGIDCRHLGDLPSLVFELGGKLLSLPPDAYAAEAEGTVPSHMQSFMRLRTLNVGNRSSPNSCNVLLMESYMDSKTGPLWIFGMPFFRKYYTTFRVGADKEDRALFVAEATEDCHPLSGASLARSRGGVHRRIDVSKLHAPPILRKTANGSRFVTL